VSWATLPPKNVKITGLLPVPTESLISSSKISAKFFGVMILGSSLALPSYLLGILFCTLY
jgi:hypothetical protein